MAADVTVGHLLSQTGGKSTFVEAKMSSTIQVMNTGGPAADPNLSDLSYVYRNQ